MALLSEEQARRIFETLITQYTGIDPEEFEDIYNSAVSEYNKNEETQKQSSLKRAYTKHRGKKAARKALRREFKKRLAEKAAKKAAATTAETGARAAVGAGGAAAAGATAAPTAGTSILIWLAAWALVELGIQLVKFARHPVEESKKWTKRLLYGIVGTIAAFLFIFFFIYAAIMTLFFGAQTQETVQPEELIIVNKTGANEIANGGEITYTFSVTYPESPNPTHTYPDDVVVTDTLPTGTQFVEVNAGTTLLCEPSPCGPTTKTFKWSSKANSIGAPFTRSFTVKLKALPAANDSYIVNIARGDATGLTPGQLPSADRALLLREVLTLLETRKLTFSQRNDREAIANGSGVIRRNDGANVTIDTQLLRAIAYLGEKGFTFNISSMVGNHARMTESGNISRHWDGHAFDVNNVNGYAVNTQSVDGKREVMNFMKTFNSLIGTDLSPRQLICAGVGRMDPEVDALSMNNSQLAPGFSARVGDHTDHIHVGY